MVKFQCASRILFVRENSWNKHNISSHPVLYTSRQIPKTSVQFRFLPQQRHEHDMPLSSFSMSGFLVGQ